MNEHDTRECLLGFSVADREQVKEMLTQHSKRVMPTLFGDGNGDNGLLQQWRDYLSRSDEREKIAAEEKEAVKRRQELWNLCYAFIGLVFTAAMAFLAYATFMRGH